MTRPGWRAPTLPLWRDIFLANRSAIDREIETLIAALREVQEHLRAGDADAIEHGIGRSREDRRRLLESELAGGPVSEVRAAVPNRPGIVAQLALAVGEAGVNIVDMALYPAPDMRSGAIALWVQGEGSRRTGDRSGGGARLQGPRGMRFDPAQRLHGSLTPPPDKSISHRAALIAAMSDGETRIRNYLRAHDTQSTLACDHAGGSVRGGRWRDADDPAAKGCAGRWSARTSTSGTPAPCCACCRDGSRDSRAAAGRSTATRASAAGRSTA